MLLLLLCSLVTVLCTLICKKIQVLIYVKTTRLGTLKTMVDTGTYTREVFHSRIQRIDLNSNPTESRILDIPCKVCGDYSSGKHYNIFACDGCAGFFKRSIRRNRRYICKGKEEGSCIIDKAHRNQCRACRLQKCQDVGMNKDAVQHERGPRNSTLRRAMSSFFEHQHRAVSAYATNSSNMPPPLVSPGGSGVLNLALPKGSGSPSTRLDTPVFPTFPIIQPTPYIYNNLMLPRMPPQTVPFQAPTLMSPPVTPPPNMMTPEAICESAARLLFMNVQWTKSLTFFTNLLMCDQLLLLEEGWKELFILGAAQFLPITDLTSLVASSVAIKKENQTLFLQQVQEFQETLAHAKQFQMDANEFSCLRIISLFKSNVSSNRNSSEADTLVEPSRVQEISNDAQVTLNKYIAATRPRDQLRFGKMLLLLTSIRNISPDGIEELFFRKTIGNIPIVKIICDMYKNHQS